MTEDSGLLIRNLAAGDLAYVFSVTLRDMRDADPSGLPDDLWYPAHRAHLERVLGDRSVTTLVACAADRPDEILGFILAEPDEAIHWVHVRRGLRGHGIALRLLTESRCLSAPLAWTTPMARSALRNPRRSRQLRNRRSRPT